MMIFIILLLNFIEFIRQFFQSLGNVVDVRRGKIVDLRRRFLTMDLVERERE